MYAANPGVTQQTEPKYVVRAGCVILSYRTEVIDDLQTVPNRQLPQHKLLPSTIQKVLAFSCAQKAEVEEACCKLDQLQKKDYNVT